MFDSIRWFLRAQKYRSQVEPHEVEFVLSHVSAGAVTVDIGAYKGAFVYWMRRRCGPTGTVYAFEPQPSLASYLRRLTRKLPNVCVEELALSDREANTELFVPLTEGRPPVSQLASLHDPGEHQPSARRLMRVPVRSTTLDTYFAGAKQRPVTFIKCDAEGHELRVFRGGERLLREDRPVLLFECDSQQPHLKDYVLELFAFLEHLGYGGHYFDRARNMVRPITSNVIEPFYSHNFAFLPVPQGTHATSTHKNCAMQPAR